MVNNMPTAAQTDLKTFADAEVFLAEALPGYQSRPNQQGLAAAIEGAIVSRTTLLAQAGCGTGKSLAYLIPAILSGRRVIVATATKGLQAQLCVADLPFLQEFLPVTFSWAMLMGRSNYFCANRAAVLDEGEIAGLAAILSAAEGILATGKPATKSDFPKLTPAEWAKICSDADFCADGNCKESGGCHAAFARKVAKEAQIVVVNHAVVATDLWLQDLTGGIAGMLGDFDIIVIDECHEFGSCVEGALGSQFSEGSILSLCAEVTNFANRNLDDASKAAISSAGARVTEAKTALWEHLDTVMAAQSPGTTQLRLRQANVDESPTFKAMGVALLNWAKAVSALSLEQVPEANIVKVRKRHQLLKQKANSLAQRFFDIIYQEVGSTEVRWIETEAVAANRFSKATTRKVIKIQPIDISEWLARVLWADVTGILTSATLPAAYVAHQLGLDLDLDR